MICFTLRPTKLDRFSGIVTAFLILLLNTPFAGHSQNSSLELTFINIIPNKGHLMLEVIDDTGNTLIQKRVKTENATRQQLRFNLNPGQYALRVFQDENDNLKLDRLLFGGPPTERYGFSNNARGTFGPPDLSTQLFSVNGSIQHTIKIY
jgi:uncharacterized protein (DUF2141 family)